MTSLDQQLRRLAVPQTQALLGDQRQRPSLLFDKSQAAAIGKDELYAIGINGLQELENIDSHFQVYENSLFGEASQSFERSQHSKEANEALDEKINEFLIKLSPYFLLRASTKALEWLIYRYRIHLNNVDAILCAIIPYYSTAAFVKVIQTFRIEKKTGRWFWLTPLQERGSPLARSALLNQSIKDPNLMDFLCSIVPKHIEVLGTETSKSLRTVISFFTSTMIGCLQLGQIKETTISTLLPYLLAGFKSKSQDFKASAFIIVSQIASTVKLEKTLVQKLMIALTKHPESQPKEMLMCLLVVCQSQDIKLIQKRTFKHICKIPGIAEYLDIMSNNYQTEKMMKLFYARLVPYAIKDSCSLASSDEGEDSDDGSHHGTRYLSLLQSMLHGSRMDDEVALHIADLFAAQYSMMKSRDMPDTVFEKIRQLFATVEKKYPNTINELAKKSSDDEDLEELLSTSSVGVILGLNHVNSDMRRVAVEKIGISRVEDEGYVREALLDRMDDDSVDVVKAVLSLKNLMALVPREELVEKLVSLMDKKFGLDEWKAVSNLAVKHVVSLWHEFQGDIWWKIYIRLLPYLLSGPDCRNKDIVALILKSKVASKDAILKGLPKSSKSADKSFVGPAFCDLASAKSEEYRRKLVDGLLSLANKAETNRVYQLVALRLFAEMIPKLRDDTLSRLQYSRYVMDIAIERLPKMRGGVDDTNGQSAFDIAEGSPLLLYALKAVLDNLRCPIPVKESKWWNPSRGEEHRLFIFLCWDVLKILSTNMSKKTCAGQICQKLVVSLRNSCLSMPDIYFNLLNAAMCGDEEITPVHMLQSLHHAKLALTNAEDDTIQNLMSSSNSTLPCLLIALKSEYQPVRTAACSLMKELVDQSLKIQPYQVLCKRLLKVSAELIASGEYVHQALNAIYEQPTEARSRRKSGVDEQLQLRTALNDLLNVISYEECSFTVKESILSILSLVADKDILMLLLPLLNAMLKKMALDSLNENETRCLHLLVHRFTPEVIGIFGESDMAKELFYTCITISKGHHEEYLSIQRLAMKQLSKEFYESLSSDEIRQSFLSHLFNVWVDNEDADMNKIFAKKVRALPLTVQQIAIELRKLLPESFETVRETKRVHRRSLEPQADQNKDSIFETKPWKRASLVLEIVQTKKKINEIHKLTQDLFSLLKYAIQQDSQSSADYFKQVVLSCLLLIYQKLIEGETLKAEELKARGAEFDVDLVIQCIRTSDSSQTYQHALMLLSKAVLLEPERVLHNVMAIFTFMGANIMRHDDSYSFKVLTDTIDSIIPALLQANQNAEDKQLAANEFLDRIHTKPKLAFSVKSILQVFVDSYPHMHHHRRLPLFEKLMMNLDPDKFLWLLMVLMIDNNVKSKTKSDEDSGEQKVDEFCLQLCDSYAVHAKIMTAYKLLMFVNTELKDVEKKDVGPQKSKGRGKASSALLDFSNYKPKEVKTVKYLMVGLVGQLLSGLEQDAKESEEKLVKVYEQAMEECLLFISFIGKAMSQETNNYWQALLKGAYVILDRLQSLLKHDVFVKVIGGLIKNDLPVIRRKTMELLVTKISSPKFSCKPEDMEEYLSLIPSLATSTRAAGTENVVVANRQAALLALRALCRVFGPQNPSKFQQLLPLVSKMITESVPAGVLSSAVALLAELVTCLRAHAVSGLGKFMPGILRILEKQRNQEPTGDPVLSNTVAAVQKIVEVLPNFISPYLKKLLSNLFWLSSRYSAQDANQKTHVAYRLLNVRSHLAKNIPARVFLPCLTNCYEDLCKESQWQAVRPIMTTLSDHISVMTSDDVSNYHNTILTLFLTALNFRVERQELGLELEKIAEVEAEINKALSSLVMKLSESTFRPLFYRLYDWATGAEVSKDRLLTFYRLCDCLASKMKNLFTKFAGHILQNVAILLEKNNTVSTQDPFFPDDKTVEKSSELLNTLLDVLHKCFLYDNEGFVTKERFDTLLPPLVLQLENMQGGAETYRERVDKHLVQCVVQLAVAAGDDGSWKPLNYQVCLKTRHSSPSVRFAALQVVESLHEKLGTDYMSLLPETIQFLAELAEDENKEVEQKCHDVIKVMEKTLGEPLSKYF